LDDLDTEEHRTLRRAFKVFTWIPALLLLASLIMVIVFRDEHSHKGDDHLIGLYGIQSLVVAAFFIFYFLFFLVYTLPFKTRLPSDELTFDPVVRCCLNVTISLSLSLSLSVFT